MASTDTYAAGIGNNDRPAYQVCHYILTVENILFQAAGKENAGPHAAN